MHKSWWSNNISNDRGCPLRKVHNYSFRCFYLLKRTLKIVSVLGEQTLSVKKNPNKDKCELKPATALSDAAINAPLHAQTDTRMEMHDRKRARLCGTCTLSGRQQGPVSDHDRAWIRGMLRANDLRHMSSPCGFKTKHCQEHSALAGQPCSLLCFSPRAESNANLQVQDETYHHLFCSVLFCCAPRPCTPLHASRRPLADLPARLERAPQHPGDRVRSHYPQWEKLLGHGWKGKIRRASRIRIKRTCVVACTKQIERLKDCERVSSS